MKNTLLALICSMGLMACASSDPKPSMAQDGAKSQTGSSLAKIDSLVSPFAQDHMGAVLLSQALSSFDLMYDSKFSPYLQEVTSHVSMYTLRDFVSYRAFVIDSAEIFSMGLPDGTILMSKGLLQELETESELAVALGVEIANIEQQYLERLMIDTQKPDDFATAFVTNEKTQEKAYDLLYKNRYPDDNINEADRLGMVYAQHFGYDPVQYNDFLARLFEKQNNANKIIGLGIYANAIVSHRQSYGMITIEKLKPMQEKFGTRKDRYPAMKKHL